ncbi:MAG TPA: hypothetical protein VNE42_11005 [Acidimicrobiales bacterium]|nr:hypothetical protein [Acidimicrobiales bacterium]
MRMRASHVEIDGEQLLLALEALIRDWPETVTYRRLGRARIGARGLLQHQRRVGDLLGSFDGARFLHPVHIRSTQETTTPGQP